MSLHLRQVILGISLVLTVLTSVYSKFDDTNDDVVDPAKKGIPMQPKSNIKIVNSNSNIGQYRTVWEISDNEVNVFPAFFDKKPQDAFKISFPVVEQAVIPPPVPAVPPLPFIYLGKMTDGMIVTIFVSQNDRNLALKGGEIIDGLYQVKSIDPQRVVFEYIPLKLEQILLVWGQQ